MHKSSAAAAEWVAFSSPVEIFCPEDQAKPPVLFEIVLEKLNWSSAVVSYLMNFAIVGHPVNSFASEADLNAEQSVGIEK